ncbi:C2H2 type zinc finger containing protein [Metarhizium album ARSEF 1941]|uniref:C2H2 type zinc finger containing protein n=1 Tax=Metarhizium album (strain ARSEF 1941) TaxID=1081103 RepID=A0A0B2WPM6_METAS|nr:C2H2 type zinc finger containing protein [Metarhizium album ARSEF 1941]KHN97996.1 C2H2 type zinc finger containing protein [Metarhizium album ARSEF 1941]
MSFVDDMDEFVDWDKAGACVDTEGISKSLTGMDNNLDADNIGLVWANVNEHDFSFHALQHFSQSPNPLEDTAGLADLPMDGTAALDFAEHVTNPCAHCASGGFACKKIQEGCYKGYCTSCVALRVECSFGGAMCDSVDIDPPASVFPADPWPIAGNHPNTITNQEPFPDVAQPGSLPSSMLDFFNNRSATPAAESGNPGASRPGPPPKIGARFSRESVRILKNWLSTHHRHPYPSDEEKEALQRQTGLNKTQITNWLANARRRGKVQPPRSTSPRVGNWAASIEIPQRRGTPALEAMNPLQRWEHSPPEHEPASVTAIARAVTASSSSALSSGLNSPYSFNFTDDGSSRSLCNQSSTSSLGTSHSSNGSRGSAYSHGSRNSWGSFGSAPFSARGRWRRRRRATPKTTNDGANSLAVPLRTFQCTFCTETFRTKHDWQRHEKSLHLSLERWVCAPDGPRVVNPESGVLSCVFCGLGNPDDAHIEAHNHTACQERTLEERTFYRKDHLNQHLRLVHNVKFMDWIMKQWKVATPEIRSRCGFCGIVMDTWTIRVDHLAEHFKTGYSMADWKGDWGFDVPVLDMVENSIPPYLIHYERVSPLPYVASSSPPESPRNAYELIKLELAYFGANHWEHHHGAPTDDYMRLEGCRIIFASELLSLQGIATQSSWLRDLIMSNENISQKARFGPLRGAAESRLASLKINGKDNLFEECPMERQLHSFVTAKRLLGLTAMDNELQEEACKIVGRVEEVSTHPSETIANWLLRLITSSTEWLEPFRRRANLPRSEDVQHATVRSKDPTSIDSTIHSYSRLERELADYLKQQRSIRHEPTDEDLQRQARVIIYEFDDGWNQTAADNIQWLESFRDRHPEGGSPEHAPTMTMDSAPARTATASDGPASCHKSPESVEAPRNNSVHNDFQQLLSIDGHSRSTLLFLNDANCYRRLAKELRRWVKSTMSANNPNRHTPTDDELQYQARWILYDDDDPWNQTAADNAEWLQRFKRDVGIAKDPGPGLPKGYSWSLSQGGSGFAPPYAYPKGSLEPFLEDVQVNMRDGAKPFKAGHDAANHFLETLRSDSSRPANVFCSRELEAGLVQFVKQRVTDTGRLPTDVAMQTRARDIVNSTETAADDPVLLEKFKAWVKSQLPDALPADDDVDVAGQQPSLLPANMDLHIPDAELGEILNVMDFDFDVGTLEAALKEQDTESGGVSVLQAPSVYE